MHKQLDMVADIDESLAKNLVDQLGTDRTCRWCKQDFLKDTDRMCSQKSYKWELDQYKQLLHCSFLKLKQIQSDRCIF